MVKCLDHFGRNYHDFTDRTAICDEVSKTLNQRLTVYRLRAWLLDVVCDILIVALSLMSVGIWLVNRYEQNGLFSSWTRCNHYQMETHNDRSGLLDNNSCHWKTWSLCTDSELGGSTRYWVGRSFDAALCWLVNKNTIERASYHERVVLFRHGSITIKRRRTISMLNYYWNQKSWSLCTDSELGCLMWYATSWS